MSKQEQQPVVNNEQIEQARLLDLNQTIWPLLPDIFFQIRWADFNIADFQKLFRRVELRETDGFENPPTEADLSVAQQLVEHSVDLKNLPPFVTASTHHWGAHRDFFSLLLDPVELGVKSPENEVASIAVFASLQGGKVATAESMRQYAVSIDLNAAETQLISTLMETTSFPMLNLNQLVRAELNQIQGEFDPAQIQDAEQATVNRLKTLIDGINRKLTLSGLPPVPMLAQALTIEEMGLIADRFEKNHWMMDSLNYYMGLTAGVAQNYDVLVALPRALSTEEFEFIQNIEAEVWCRREEEILAFLEQEEEYPTWLSPERDVHQVIERFPLIDHRTKVAIAATLIRPKIDQVPMNYKPDQWQANVELLERYLFGGVSGAQLARERSVTPSAISFLLKRTADELIRLYQILPEGYELDIRLQKEVMLERGWQVYDSVMELIASRSSAEEIYSTLGLNTRSISTYRRYMRQFGVEIPTLIDTSPYEHVQTAQRLAQAEVSQLSNVFADLDWSFLEFNNHSDTKYVYSLTSLASELGIALAKKWDEAVGELERHNVVVGQLEVKARPSSKRTFVFRWIAAQQKELALEVLRQYANKKPE